jgi:putative transposase
VDRAATPRIVSSSQSVPLVLFDDDAKLGGDVLRFLKLSDLLPMQTSIRSPWQNGIAERFVGSIRRELLDHVIPLNECHLRPLGREYLAHHHKDRTHIGLDKKTPSGRVVEPRCHEPAQILAEPRVGGLHHRYTWSVAA